MNSSVSTLIVKQSQEISGSGQTSLQYEESVNLGKITDSYFFLPTSGIFAGSPSPSTTHMKAVDGQPSCACVVSLKLV